MAPDERMYRLLLFNLVVCGRAGQPDYLNRITLKISTPFRGEIFTAADSVEPLGEPNGQKAL